MADQNDIVNLAQTFLGEDGIMEIGQEQEWARRLAVVWDVCRDAVLVDHFWNFAEAEQLLSQLPGQPINFSHRYALPNDPFCLKARMLDIEYKTGDRSIEWKVAGRELHVSAEPPLVLIYTRLVTDTQIFSPWFNMCLAAYLAWTAGFRVTQDLGYSTQAKGRYDDFLAKGKTHDAQEGSPIKLFQDKYVASRR